MANYTILVHNKSGDDHEYVLFNEMPKPGPTPGKGVFQNAYITSKMVTNDTGTCNFQIQLVINAVTGTRSERAENGINDVIKVHDGLNNIATNSQRNMTDALQSGSGKTKAETAISDLVSTQICQTTNGEASLGSAVHVSIVEGKPKFETQEPKQTCAVDGSFSIAVDGSFESPSNDNTFVGFSCNDPYDHANSNTAIIPIPAQPNTTNIVTPVSRYYVSWGSRTIGERATSSTMGTPAVIEFYGKSSSSADVVHNKNGTWTVSYI